MFIFIFIFFPTDILDALIDATHTFDCIRALASRQSRFRRDVVQDVAGEVDKQEFLLAKLYALLLPVEFNKLVLNLIHGGRLDRRILRELESYFVRRETVYRGQALWGVYSIFWEKRYSPGEIAELEKAFLTEHGSSGEERDGSFYNFAERELVDYGGSSTRGGKKGIFERLVNEHCVSFTLFSLEHKYKF